jgi:hypothetical protein
MDRKNDQKYLDAYFIVRRGKEIRRFIIALFALIFGGAVALFGDPIAAYLKTEPGLIKNVALIINVGGFGLLTLWILDGKEYVFPRKVRGGDE